MRGKGVFVRRIRHLDTDPIVAARKLSGWGFEWAAPTILGSSGELNRAVTFWTEATKRGMALIPHWILPKPRTWRAEIASFFDFVDELRRRGVPLRAVMLDPEAEWRGDPEAAEAFARTFFEMARARSLKVVLTTYAMPPPDFPLEVFAQYADAGLAQTYYTTSTYGADIFRRSLARWRSRGFANKPVILCGSYWQKYVEPERTKTPEEWVAFLQVLPPTPGLCIWPTTSWSGAVVPLLEITKAWKPGVVPTGARVMLSGLPFGDTIASAIFGG